MSRRVGLTIPAALTALAIHMLMAPLPARGESGDRKIFAAGAGARALGLGGAYTAAADDPTALVWNPAGLLRVPSKELAFYTTTLPAEGLSYAFFGYAHPTLRYGALGFGAMRFSAGGIEGRDERNFVTDPSLDDTQMRWLFGYANRVTPEITLGVGLKVDTHSLAGVSATSMGADLAASYRREGFGASALSLSRLGAAVRLENALAPREKLGGESVSEPRALHAGLSYELPLGGRWGGALAVADWVREAGGEERFVVGSEMRSSGMAARAGLGSEAWSAGAGVDVRGLSIDYAYAPGDLEASHRVSLHYAFGHTVDEMLTEEREREEAEVNARLAREIGEREASRVTALVDSGRTHLAEGRFEEARNAFEGALLFVPGQPEYVSLLRQAEVSAFRATAQRRIAAGDTVEALIAYRQALEMTPDDKRLREEIDAISASREASRAATDTAREREAAGVEALAAGRYVEAISLFTTMVQADPKSEDARRFLQLAQTGFTNEFNLLVSQGALLLERGLGEQAIAKWKSALVMAPNDKDLKKRVENAEREIAGVAGRRESERHAAPQAQPPVALSTAERSEVSDLYEQGVKVFKEGRTAEAIEYWEIVWRRDPSFGDVKSYLTKGYLIQGMEHYTAGRLPQAIEVWRRALDVDPEDEKTLHYVERASAELARTREITRK
jgi:tetratricopeptide (TPR) repeat protein